ncbi:MAG: hypothetical protein SXA11_12540 [Cyanobacteriota bacterium]|nr:hypothetical protein [Cyanobacteriota bacterium]
MNEIKNTSQFQLAIEAVEALSLEDQGMVLEILKRRIYQQRRNQLLEEIALVRQEYAEGNVKFGSVEDFLEELDD